MSFGVLMTNVVYGKSYSKVFIICRVRKMTLVLLLPYVTYINKGHNCESQLSMAVQM